MPKMISPENTNRTKGGEVRKEDETRRPMPKQTLVKQGLRPHQGPDEEETGSPTAAQRYRWKRKSIWEASDDETGTNEVATSRARTQSGEPQTNPAEKVRNQKGKGG